MVDGVDISADFRQTRRKGDEEEPVIVAQRFLNIFRQLHIFNDERKSVFNKMLLDLPYEVQAFFHTLPGGAPLREYIDELNGIIAPPKTKENSQPAPENILQSAINENASAQNVSGMSSDNFAKVLASSLAQSNAEIIKEMQNAQPYSPPSQPHSSSEQSFKLVADDAFTQIISKAISSSIESAEKKRHEDNNLIANSFMELQHNLTKLVEQNGQLKIISNSDSPADAAALFQVKDMVDDLLKSQSEFLKETTKNQKEVLSSTISQAIKESQKLSTEALIESFKHLESGGPAPITFASSSPTQSVETVELALKAQGKEFSSIISTALKESHKNSTQAIIETIETLRKDAGGIQTADKQLNIEEIMRMQAHLFKEITQAQNREFSALISSALKESHAQSTKTIVSALNQIQSSATDFLAQPRSSVGREYTPQVEYDYPAAPAVEQPRKETPKTEEILLEQKADELPKHQTNLAAETALNSDESEGLTSKKKKKKKKKKNQEQVVAESSLANADEQPRKSFINIETAGEIAKISDIVDTDDDFDSWGWGNSTQDEPVVLEPAEKVAVEEPAEVEQLFQELEMSLQTVSSDEASSEEDWEWSYEESEGEEGVDWEWDYAEEEALAGNEGVDWEWEYEEGDAEEDQIELSEETEEVIASAETETEENELVADTSNDGYLWIEEEIKHPEPFVISMIGLEYDTFVDPYL